jgi:hypothetical protein
MAKNQIPVGMLSGRPEQEQYGFEPRSRVYAGKDYGWQTEDSYKKTVEQRKGAGFYNSLGQALAPARNVFFQGIQSIEPLLNGVSGVLENSHAGPLLEQIDGATEYIEDLAVQHGFDRRVGTSAAMLGEEVLTAGLGKAGGSLVRNIKNLPPPPPRQMVAAASSVGIQNIIPQLQSPSKGGQVLEAVTGTVPEVLAKTGVKTGDDLMNVPQMKRYITRSKNIEKTKSRISLLNDQIDALNELKGDPANLSIYLQDNPDLKDLFVKYSDRKDTFQKVKDSLVDRRNNANESLSIYESNVLVPSKDNPFFFRTVKGLAAKKQQQLKQGTIGFLEQHHRFGKGMSAAYFSKMDELISNGIAEPDDLVLMAQYAKAMGKEAGDVKSNMLNMKKATHNELHTTLRNLGEEPSKSFLKNQLKKIDNVDDLLTKWVEFLDDTASYNMKTADTWEPLDSLLQELRSN